MDDASTKLPDAEKATALAEETCAHAFRALRFVFSCDRERVRVAFKPLFPPDLFAAFIDVGQYKPELERYEGVAARWLAQSEQSAARFADALEETLKPADPRAFAPDGFAFDDWRARLPAGEAGDFASLTASRTLPASCAGTRSSSAWARAPSARCTARSERAAAAASAPRTSAGRAP